MLPNAGEAEQACGLGLGRRCFSTVYGEVGKSECDSIKQTLADILAVPTLSFARKATAKNFDLFGN